MSCPKCGSNEWKSASLVHSQGLNYVKTNTNSLGAGISSGGIIFGGGESSTEGWHQTALSAAAGPPKDPSDMTGRWIIICFLILIIGWVILDSMDLPFFDGLLYFFLFFVCWLVLFLYLELKPEKPPSGEYKRRLEIWYKTRMCTRCGCFYIENCTEPESAYRNAYDEDKQRALRHKYPY